MKIPLTQNKKGDVTAGMFALITVAIMLVVVGFVLGIGAGILTTQQATQTSGTFAYNASGYALQGINTLAQQQTSVAGIGVLAVFIIILFGVLAYLKFNN